MATKTFHQRAVVRALFVTTLLSCALFGAVSAVGLKEDRLSWLHWLGFCSSCASLLLVGALVEFPVARNGQDILTATAARSSSDSIKRAGDSHAEEAAILNDDPQSAWQDALHGILGIVEGLRAMNASPGMVALNNDLTVSLLRVLLGSLNLIIQGSAHSQRKLVHLQEELEHLHHLASPLFDDECSLTLENRLNPAAGYFVHVEVLEHCLLACLYQVSQRCVPGEVHLKAELMGYNELRALHLSITYNIVDFVGFTDASRPLLKGSGTFLSMALREAGGSIEVEREAALGLGHTVRSQCYNGDSQTDLTNQRSDRCEVVLIHIPVKFSNTFTGSGGTGQGEDDQRLTAETESGGGAATAGPNTSGVPASSFNIHDPAVEGSQARASSSAAPAEGWTALDPEEVKVQILQSTRMDAMTPRRLPKAHAMPLKILHVEDERVQSFYFRHKCNRLFGEECTVVSEADGLGALKRLQADEVFDVIVSDIYMAVLDGISFFTALLDTPVAHNNPSRMVKPLHILLTEAHISPEKVEGQLYTQVENLKRNSVLLYNKTCGLDVISDVIKPHVSFVWKLRRLQARHAAKLGNDGLSLHGWGN